MWPLAFHAHLSFLSSINNGTLSVCCRVVVPVLCRTVLLFSSINIICSHFYIVTIINVYRVSVYFVKISTKRFFWLPFSFMRMIFVCFLLCFVCVHNRWRCHRNRLLFDSSANSNISLYLLVQFFISSSSSVFDLRCDSFIYRLLLLRLWWTNRLLYFISYKIHFRRNFIGDSKMVNVCHFFLLSYSFIFIQLSIFKSEFHMWSYLFWCLVFCVAQPQLSFFDENINKLILKIGNDKRNQLGPSSDWQRKHAGKKTQPLWTNEIK